VQNVHITGDKQIESAVAIVIAPRGASGPVAQLHSRFICHVRESAVVVIVVKPVFAPVGYVNIRPAIIVVVGDGNANAPAVVGYANLGRDIGKSSIVVIVEEGRMRWRFFAVQSIEGRTVYYVDIKPAIIVIIDQAHSRSIRFDNVVLFGRAHLVGPMSQPGLF